MVCHINFQPITRISRTIMNVSHWRPGHFRRYPKIMYLLPTLLMLNHTVAIGELVCSIWFNSLGLFSHGCHMIFNSIILTGLITSVYVNWGETGQYSIRCVGLVARANFVVGVVFFINSIVVGYFGAQNILEPPEIRDESLFVLIPWPSFLLNLVSMYVILHGNMDYDIDYTADEGEARILPVERVEVPAPKNDRSMSSICKHILANIFGSVLTIVLTILVQYLEWTFFDTVVTCIIVLLMFGCAIYLMKESIDIAIDESRQGRQVQQLRKCIADRQRVKSETTSSASNIFTIY